MTKGRLILLWILFAWLCFALLFPAYHPAIGSPPKKEPKPHYTPLDSCINAEWMQELSRRLSSGTTPEQIREAHPQMVRLIARRCSATEEQVRTVLGRQPTPTEILEQLRQGRSYRPSYWELNPEQSLLLALPGLLLAVPLWFTLGPKKLQ